MRAAVFQLLAWTAAFWVAVGLHARRQPGRSIRLGFALLLGAALAHLGNALLWGRPRAAFDPRGGASVLFAPLALFAVRAGPAAFASLPLPLAVARLGCLAAGCCRGAAGERIPLFEMAALAALHAALARAPVPAAPERFAWGFGALRLSEAAWRPPVGDAALAGLATPEAVAVGWLAAGTWLAVGRRVTKSGRSPHASVAAPSGRSTPSDR